MAQSRQPAVAGQFYSNNSDDLKNDVDAFLKNAKKTSSKINPKLVICPHAGYVFSGQIASDGIAQINRSKTKRVIIIASAHHFHFEGVSVYNGDAYKTPLGEVEVDKQAANELITNYDFIDFIPDAHKYEHCIEVEIPILQRHLHSFKIVPVLIGSYEKNISGKLAASLENLYDDETVFVVSTDFSHYPDYNLANQIDKETANAIITGKPEKLIEILSKHKNSKKPGLSTDLCGWTSVLSAMELLKDKNMEYEIISYANSGDSPYGDHDRVVGYYSIIAGMKEEKDTNFMFSNDEKETLLILARNSLKFQFDSSGVYNSDLDINENLKTKCGAFVSLYNKDDLRGCIGSFTSNSPLYQVVERMAAAAGFSDTRFSSISENELDDIRIEISVLTPLKKIYNIKEIEIGTHGIYIISGQASGTLLPQVASERNWSVEEFLGHCSRDKAGIGWEGWKDAEIFIYEAIVFSD